MQLPVQLQKQLGIKTKHAFLLNYQHVKIPYEWGELLIAFTVPGQPVPKGRPRLGLKGQTYTPEKTKAAEARIKQYIFVAHPNFQPYTGLVGIKAKFFMQDYRRSDGDNCLKLVQDSTNKLVVLDDYQYKKFEVEVYNCCSEPRTEIAIYALAT